MMKKRGFWLVVGLFATMQAHASDELLNNAGFEESKTGIFGVEFTDWNMPLGLAAVENTDKIEGTQALKTVEATQNISYIQQEIAINETGLVAGDSCEVVIHYKVLTPQSDGDVRLDCYWDHRTDGELKHDSTLLRTKPFTASEWAEKRVRTSVPEGASRFHFRVGITKKSVVLLDDFSFKFVSNATAEPRLVVTPTGLNSVSTAVNTTVAMTPLTISQANLTTPVTIQITGSGSKHFAVSTTEITAAEEQLTVSYHPTAVGTHKAMLIIESSAHPELSKTISLTGKSYDPSKPPTLHIAPTTIAPFATDINTDSSVTIQLTSENCIDYVYARVEHQQGAAFTINGSMFAQNTTTPVRITFKAVQAGEYSSRIIFSSEKADDVVLTVSGTASGTTGKTDYDSTFVWNMANPRKLLIENFDTGEHNTKLELDDWQNVVVKGQRPWWGYTEKADDGATTDKYAKATGYIWQHPESNPIEMWLVTPPLDFVNAASKLFTFRVMGDFMFEGHQTTLELYYIDTIAGQNLFKQKIDMDIPATNDLNGEWCEFHIDLTGQNISDVFFMAFRFAGQSGSEHSATYYIDDVSWGRTDVPTLSTDSTSVIMTAEPNKTITSTPIKVTTKNLTAPVTLSIGGANAGKFELSTQTLSQAGGQFTVSFESDTEGVHEAYIKLASRGAADKFIVMSVLVKQSTGLVTTNGENVFVWSADRTLHIEADTPHDIVIYSVGGHCIWQGRTASAAIPAQQGVYIVDIDGQKLKTTLF